MHRPRDRHRVDVLGTELELLDAGERLSLEVADPARLLASGGAAATPVQTNFSAAAKVRSWPRSDLHSTDASRPKPAGRIAPKQTDGEPSLFLFRFYEAAVRDLTHPAYSVEKLDVYRERHFRGGTSTLAEVAIGDPGSI
jgi:hypothetical protein